MSLKTKLMRMRADIRSAYKSEDTEEWWDRVFTKPIGYLWARFFIRIGWTPNMVTVLSMCIGFAGGCMFAGESFAANLIGVFLIIWANIYDSTDGQMARLTGMKSMLGRILDALSTSVWYAAIYVALSIRMMNRAIPFTGGTWGGLIWIIAFLSAFCAHQPQCMTADYYRNVHLFFLNNENGSEHDTSRDIFLRMAELPKGAYFRKLYLYLYGLYTRLQETVTPDTQKLFEAVNKAGLSQEVRSDYLEQSRKYLFLTNILTFNVRAYTLFACVLLDVPVLYFAIELLVLNVLMVYMVGKYETIARNVLYSHDLPGSEFPYKKPNRWPAVFFCFGLVGVITTLAKTDLKVIDWSGVVLGRIHLWLPAIIGVWALIYILHAVAYAVIIGPDSKKLKPLHLFRMVISGFALNNVTPVGLAGGEPYRIMELKSFIGTEKATASTLTFTIMHIVAHVAFWFTGALMFILTGCKGGWLAAVISVIIMAGTGWALFAYFKSKGDGLVKGTLEKLSRLPVVGKYLSRLLTEKAENITNIDREMASFHERKRDFYITFAIEYLGRLLEAAELFALLRILGVSISIWYSIVGMATASLIGNLVFFIPMQMGSREAGFALAFSWAGVVTSLGVTTSLLLRIREIFYTVAGVAMMLMKADKSETTDKQG